MSNSPPNPSDPEKYILAIRNDDKRIVHEIYAAFLSSITAWIEKNNGSTQDARDIFQESLMVIVRKVSNDASFMPDSPFGAYLFGIARKLWLKKLNNDKRDIEKVRNKEWEEHIGTAAFEAMIEASIDGDRWLAVLERSFSQLTSLCQKILTLYREGKKASEIAAQLDMTVNAVYRRKHACSESWRTFAEEDPDFEKYNPY